MTDPSSSLTPADAAYVERARSAAARLSSPDVAADDVRHALLVVEHHAMVDVEVPTAAALAPVGIVKRVLKRLLLWWFRYVGQQVTALGQATTRLGNALAERVDRLDEDVSDLRRRVEQLERDRS